MGAQENNGLTLEGLAQKLETQAQRLETLESENERISSENAELRSKIATLEEGHPRREDVAALRGSDRRRDRELVSQFEGRVSRRSLLSKAGAAAMAAVAAGTLVGTRAANASHSTNIIWAHLVDAHHVVAETGNSDAALVARTVSNTNPAVNASNNGSRPAVEASNVGAGEGVLGDSRSGTGVKGSGVTGVWGSSGTIGHAAVLGEHSNAGFDAIGVRGETVDGVGVKGTGKVGVIGESPTEGHASVYGQHVGSSGYGVVGDGTGTRGAGVFGRNPSGAGVEAGGSRYGGKFAGSRAQLWLVPKGTAGEPTGTHLKGEIYMDSTGTLFVCVASSTATAAARWRKVTTTAV